MLTFHQIVHCLNWLKFIFILQRKCFDHNGHSGGNSGVESSKVGAPGGAPATTTKTVAHGKVALGGGQNNATKGGNSSAADGDYQVKLGTVFLLRITDIKCGFINFIVHHFRCHMDMIHIVYICLLISNA